MNYRQYSPSSSYQEHCGIQCLIFSAGAVASIGRITPDFLPIRFSCTGNEARLRDCPIMGITECSGEAAVFCQAGMA